MFVMFVVKDTATPEIYTYGHPLSLHDALPVYEVLIQVAARMKSALGRDEVIGRLGGDEFLVLLPRVKGFQNAENAVQSLFASLDKSFERSEEHTSELQSLMRISYAVFCLKKKKTNN